jgi:hypothetical protein
MLTNPKPTRYSNLSPARERLVDVFCGLPFGRIEHLVIVGGEPQFHPAPVVIQTMKLPAEAYTSTVPTGDFVLKKQILDLFECFDRWQNATILRLECRFGVPFLVEVKVGQLAESHHRTDRSHQ